MVVHNQRSLQALANHETFTGKSVQNITQESIGLIIESPGNDLDMI